MKARVTDKETVMAEQDTQYYVAARYPSKQTAGKAYTSIERLIYEADCDLSAYRYFVRSERYWYVVIVGEVPPAPLHERFVFRRATGGSHEIWWHEGKRRTCVVPHHKEVKAGTLRSILRQASISEEQFLKAA
jgi:HicA toxin of bacterial toxin-antitoxin,